MITITKVYKESMPATRFIGKKYGNEDRVDGGFGHLWGEWFENDYFGTIAKAVDGELADFFVEAGATIGLMTAENGIFQYWIGYFTPTTTPVPDGFQSVDFAANNLGVCWVHGYEHEVFMQEENCAKQLAEAGIKINDNWCFERYTCRFTEQDSDGKIILDVCYFVE